MPSPRVPQTLEGQIVPEPIRRSAASAWQAGRRYGTDGDFGCLNSSSDT